MRPGGTQVQAAGLQRYKIRLGDQLKPRKYALLIGINRSVRSSFWRPLRYAKRDAERMAHLLLVKASFDRVILLTSPKDTTKSSILRALQRLNKLIKSPEDTVLIYISAHGTLSRGRWRYIVTSDTTRRVEQTGLSVRFFQKQMSRLGARKKGLILATCYAGSTRSKAVRVPGSKGAAASPRPFPHERAIQILSAASFAQSAFESERFKADVYTHFFINCFQRLSHKTIIKIHVCAAGLTTPFVQKWNGQIQVPKAYSQIGANRDFVLVGPRFRQRKMGYFRPSTRHRGFFYRLFRLGAKGADETGRVMSTNAHPIDAASHEWVAAPPGRYRVVLLDVMGKVVERTEITIQSGKTSRLLSQWSLELQGGTWASTGYLRKNGDWYGSFFFGARRRYFAVLLGGWTGALEFDGKVYQQLAFEARTEAGYRGKWGAFDLFVGGFLGIGLLLQDINQRPTPSFVLRPGLTLAPSFWLSDRWGLVLGLDLSVLPVWFDGGVRWAFAGGVRLALRFRLLQ